MTVHDAIRAAHALEAEAEAGWPGGFDRDGVLARGRAVVGVFAGAVDAEGTEADKARKARALVLALRREKKGGGR